MIYLQKKMQCIPIHCQCPILCHSSSSHSSCQSICSIYCSVHHSECQCHAVYQILRTNKPSFCPRIICKNHCSYHNGGRWSWRPLTASLVSVRCAHNNLST